MIIDFHTHTGNNKIKCSLEDIKKSMSSFKIDCSVVFPMYRENPKELIEQSINNVAKDSKLIPFLRFSPSLMDLKEFSILSGKFHGFKLHPRGENFDPLDEKFDKIFKEIQKTKKPVIIHTRKENSPNSDPDRLARIAEIYPKINFVFGHFANDSNEFFKQVLNYDNLFVETSIVSSPKIIELRCNQIGADRILFGSDFPYSDQEIELLKIKKSNLSSEEKEKILGLNAQKILNLVS